MILLTKASERRTIDQGKFIIRLIFPGLKLHNLSDVGLGPLGRVDHATLEAGMVVPMHSHQNDEILSYLRKGTMLHTDNSGNEMALDASHLMMMNAGSGIGHEEAVPAGSETVEMLQVFIRPEADNLQPQVQFHRFGTASSTNAWRLVGGPAASGAPLLIRSSLQLLDARLEGSRLSTPVLEGRTGFLYVFDGEVSLEGKSLSLKKGDALLIRDEQLSLQAKGTTDLVFFVVDTTATYTRSGRYSG